MVVAGAVAVLEARGVAVAVAGRLVLDAVTLQLPAGQVTAVIGPNGAGKSTLLACLSGARIPAAGVVRLNGNDLRALSVSCLSRYRSVLEQTPTLAAPFTLAELIDLGIPRAVPPRTTRRIVHRAAAAMGLSSHHHQPVDRLSGGERQRAHMARSLAQLWAGQHLGAGHWLLLDEPTNSLDFAHQVAVVQASRQVAAEGAGVVVVLHDLTLAAAVADNVILMHQGKIMAFGAKRDVLQPATLEPAYGVKLLVSEPVTDTLVVTPLFG